MNSQTFHHALQFREDICIGCSHCMNVCPTEAIRVHNGKAKLLDNRCVDCGECYRVCPVGAIIVEQDELDSIFKFTHRIALVPAVFSGQFPDNITKDEIFNSIYELGFTEVYEVEYSVDFLVEEYAHYFNRVKLRPLISTFCPAIVRLIQVKFPTLIPHLMLLKAPLDFTALHARKVLCDKGVNPIDIGVFYITPCAAKIVAIKSPLGEDKSAIDGAINMNYLFNKSLKSIKNGLSTKYNHKPLDKKSIVWSLTNGEADNIHDARALAIDEISNVIEFLEKVENDEMKGVDFLELRACDESCAGGILCPSNRFLVAEKLRKRAVFCGDIKSTSNDVQASNVLLNKDFLHENACINPIEARSIMKLDDNIAEAMSKMKRMFDINRLLPQVDCGICGNPSCQSFAEDIVQNKAKIKQCVFVQKVLEQNEKMDIQESVDIMKNIWGFKKLDRNSLRDELNDVM